MTARNAATPDGGAGGVWIVGTWDWDFIADSVYATELEALRVVNDRGYGEVHFAPFGAEFRDVAMSKIKVRKEASQP